MDVYKQPVTDPSKVSKRGRLSLRRNSDGLFETVERGAGKPEEVTPILESCPKTVQTYRQGISMTILSILLMSLNKITL